MLENLLTTIRSGGSWTTKALAQQLGTSVEMVEAMMEQLQHLGLVHDFKAPCTESCRQCAFNVTCHAVEGSHPRLWKA